MRRLRSRRRGHGLALIDQPADEGAPRPRRLARAGNGRDRAAVGQEIEVATAWGPFRRGEVQERD